jgi:hypothetical protein
MVKKYSAILSLGITLLILFCVVLLLNIYSPLRVDDFMKQFNISLISMEFTDEKIDSLEELFKNMWYHRYILNGRLSDALVIFLLYTVGKGGFNILNSFILILSLCFVCKLTLKTITYRHLLVCMALSILLIPRLSGTIFWLSGACNYLWVVPFICCFIYLFEQYFIKNHLPLYKKILLFVCLFFSCSMHEASGLIICGMQFLLIIYQTIRGENKRILYLTLLFSALSTAIPLSAPGIWHRAREGTPSSLFVYVTESIPPFFSHCWLPLSLFFFCLYKTGIKPLLTIRGAYSLSALICTLAFMGNGGWGGGYFYLNLSLLLYLLSNSKYFTFYKTSFVLKVAYAVIICAIVLQFLDFYKIDMILKEEKIKAFNTKLFSIDISQDDYQKYQGWYLKFGTSSQNSPVTPKQYSIIWKIPEHRVVFNTIHFDKNIYNEFPSDKTDVPLSIKTNGLCIIRLPKGFEPVDTSLTLKNSGNNENLPTCLLYRKYSLWEQIVVKSKSNRMLRLYSISCHNDFYYLILPELASHYHEINCPVFLPNGEKQSLCIKLNENN